MRALEAFINRTRGVSNLDILRDHLEHALIEEGIAFFAYNIARVAGVGADLTYFNTNYPEQWVSRYLSQGYFEIDPIVHEGFRQRLPFIWDDVFPLDEMTPMQRQLFDEAAGFGFHCGMTVPIHGRDGALATMSVVPCGSAAEQRAVLVEKRDIIHMISLYYHAHAAPYVLERYLRRNSPVLTSDERRVLQGLANGQNSSAIASQLAIREPLVEMHINALKQKLGASSSAHLVIKATMADCMAV